MYSNNAFISLALDENDCAPTWLVSPHLYIDAAIAGSFSNHYSVAHVFEQRSDQILELPRP